MKQATDPILRRLEGLCSPLAGWTILESTGNNEAFGSRRNNTSASPHVPSTTMTSKKITHFRFRENFQAQSQFPLSFSDFQKNVNSSVALFNQLTVLSHTTLRSSTILLKRNGTLGCEKEI